ncbi:hypothetical protein [Maridesulfovibrio sp.]|uniref:hypothetical protein n=1 Tax=Maridesulfovibrio sp. TaxID=2795000 RepID=UPI002A18B79E|nr:hypothetical protein [Maridesulfovibrio sp.]
MKNKNVFFATALLIVFLAAVAFPLRAGAYDNYDFWIQTPTGWTTNTQGLSDDLKKQVISPDRNAFVEVYAAKGNNPGLQRIADGMEQGILNRGGVYFQNRISSRNVQADGHPAIFREYSSTYNGSRLHAYGLYTYANGGAVVAIGVYAEQFAGQYRNLVYNSVTSLRFSPPPTMSSNTPYGAGNTPYGGNDPYGSSTDACSRLVGKWKWFTGSVAEFYAGGRMPGAGNSWKCADPSRGTFIITWSNGKWVDTLTMSQDGNRLDGQNQIGNRVWGTRLSGAVSAAPPPAPARQPVPKMNYAKRIKGNMGAQWRLAHGSLNPAHPQDNAEWELSTVAGTTLRFTDPYNQGKQRYRVKIMTKNGQTVEEKVVGLSEHITVSPGLYKIQLFPEGGYAGWKCEWH